MTVVHFHLIVLHFPIALLITGALLELAVLATGRESLKPGARVCLVLGTLAAVATALSGNAAEEIVEEAVPVSEAVLERHEELGMWAMYLAIGLLSAELATLRIRNLGFRWLVAILAVVTAVLVGVAGFSGGKIRHDAPFEGGSGRAGADLFVPASGEVEHDLH